MTAGRLQDVHALVTRPRERAEELCFLLEDEGARVTALPLLELVPPEDPRPLQAAAERLSRFDWVAFSSPSGVAALVDAARQAHGLSVERQAGAGGGAALAEVMRPSLHPGDRVLLPAAAGGRPELREALEALGAEATQVCAYRALEVELDAALVAGLERDPPALAFFGSPRTAEALWDALGPDRARALLAGAASIAIGPTTRAALDELGAPRAATAPRPTPEAMVDAAVSALATR